MGFLESDQQWVPAYPQRYSPTLPKISYADENTISETSSTRTSTLIYERFQYMNRCKFELPPSDDLIRADTRERIPLFPVPDENDGTSIVRRYLYNILTSTRWDISAKYPAAVRYTVDSWYGNGGYFRSNVVDKDGLYDICPKHGNDDHGVEVFFGFRIRSKIASCVRYESQMLLDQESRSSHATLQVAANDRTNNSVHEEYMSTAKEPLPRFADDDSDPNSPQYSQSLHSDDVSVYSRLGEDDTKYHTLSHNSKYRHDSASSFDMNDLDPAIIASVKIPDKKPINLRVGVTSPPEYIHSLTIDEPAEISRTSITSQRSESLRSLGTEPVPYEEPRIELNGDTQTVRCDDAVQLNNFLVTDLKEKHLKRAESARVTSTQVIAPIRPLSSCGFLDKRPGGYKYRRPAFKPLDDPKIVSPVDARLGDIISQERPHSRLGGALMTAYYGKHETDRRNKAKQETSNANQTQKLRRASSDTLFAPEREALTAAAKRAQNAKLDEAKDLDHHTRSPAPKKNLLARIFRRLGGRRK
ncbi:hypothetical protein EJ02DRAFT_420434 [Clathrospora elynae]|uniref:Uncharacterized protein n=1 Tax=Clathrospora elynae TaxID=706981 RepID=A0A6A5T0X1_9PLEO|nr:hypothetical protein EJ02DRAFT_420434 [Clathrospora elynae]